MPPRVVYAPSGLWSFSLLHTTAVQRNVHKRCSRTLTRLTEDLDKECARWSLLFERAALFLTGLVHKLVPKHGKAYRKYIAARNAALRRQMANILSRGTK